jgi:hypothetical protein
MVVAVVANSTKSDMEGQIWVVWPRVVVVCLLLPLLCFVFCVFWAYVVVSFAWTRVYLFPRADQLINRNYGKGDG